MISSTIEDYGSLCTLSLSVDAIDEESRRFSIEDISFPTRDVKITQSKNGYSVHVQYEERAPYVADLYLLVAYDKQVEITR